MKAFTKVYRFEKETFNGNRWSHRIEQVFFIDGRNYINKDTSHYDNDQNVILRKPTEQMSEEDFKNFIYENKIFLIEEYKISEYLKQ